MNAIYDAQVFAEEIEDLINHHRLDGQVATGAIAILLAKYGMVAESAGLMSKDGLIDRVATVAKQLRPGEG